MAEAQFLKCEAQGRYDHVTAGEACSISVAQRIGVFDKDTYFSAPFNNSTKTLSEDPVASVTDKVKPAALCSTSDDPDRQHLAFPLCGVLTGPNTQREESPNGTATCVTSECPPGFTQEGGNCIKPVKPSKVDKSQRCDARWYDWFLVENAHLMNGTQQDAQGTCFLPCPTGFVPNMSKNPVDGSIKDLFGKDDLSQCVPKSEFFFRKYADTPDFCPLAWIYRLTTRPEDFKKGTELEIEALKGSSHVSEASETQALLNASSDSGDLYTSMLGVTDTQIRAGNPIGMKGQYLQACKSLNTPERLKYAHSVCEPLRTNPEGFRAKWSVFWGDKTDERMALLKKACHLVCCDDNNMASIGKKTMCFENKDLLASLLKPKAKEDPKDAASAKKKKQVEDEGYASPAQKTFVGSFQWLIMLIIIPVMFVILWVTLVPALALAWWWVRYMVFGVKRPGDVEGLKDTAEGIRINEEELSRLSELALANGTRAEKWRQLFGGMFMWVWSNLGYLVSNVSSLFLRILGYSADKAVDAAGKVGSTFMDGFMKNVFASAAVVFSIVFLFVLAMFIYFFIMVHDIRFGRSGSGWSKFETFLNVFNWRDWEIFNWREFWGIRAINDLLNPYRSTRSPDTIARGVLKEGRCDNVKWVESDSKDTCSATVKPDPIKWGMTFPEGFAVPSTLRSNFPQDVAIPWEDTENGFTPSCDVSVTGKDGKVVQLLSPVEGDPNSCVKNRIEAPSFTDKYRPKMQSTHWAGLDGYAESSDPKC